MTDDVRRAERQLGLLAISLISSGLLAIAVWGQRDQALQRHPERDYRYTRTLAVTAALLSSGLALVWVWLSWKDCRESPEDKTLTVPLAANALAAAAALLRFRMGLKS
jgi:hypothetical protein